MSLSVGARLGHYDVTALIGEGGMGQVYQATDTQLGRDVALKILPDAFAADPDRLARFQREAQVLASLNHPGIAAIYGIEKSDDTQALVLELVEGPTLADRIAQGAIPVDERLPIAKQIAEALEAAHEAGVIHRDLKPANIKVREDGTVKVLDFGLAKALDTTPQGDPSLSPTLTAAATQMGVIMGTAAYMSPKQARGKPVDKRTDIWSFGCVLFEMLTGQRAFQGEDVSLTLASVMKSDLNVRTLPPDVPATVRTVLRRCLEKDPAQRIRDIGDVRLAMEGVFDPGIGAESEQVPAPESRAWQRPVPLALLVLVVAVSAALGGWAYRPSELRDISRFAYDLPVGHELRGNTRAVLAVSPDGRRFVYNTTEGLYLRSLDTLEARLLRGTEEDIRNPAFSPDGQSLAYLTRNPSQLKRLALSGGAPVVIAEGVETSWGVSWATDGTVLVGQPQGVLRVPATGGTPELVVPAGDGELLDGPRLLPDGDTVLLSVGTGAQGAQGDAGRWSNSSIVAVSLTTRERTLLIEGGGDARYVSTGHLVYALDDGLFAVAFDAGTLTVAGGTASVVEGIYRATATSAANYAVSDDGTLFYLEGAAESHQPLVWVDRTGRSDVIETIPPNLYSSPRLAPGGERVLVVAHGDARVYDLASGRESRMTTDGLTAVYAGWSPSGTEIAYTSGRGTEGRLNVWTQPADRSGAARQVTGLEGEVHFDSWAPGGRTMSAHHHAGGTTNQLIISLDNGNTEPEAWLERPYTDNNAVFSPDGRYVAYLSAATGRNQIYIRPFPGPGGETPVSVGEAREPVWAPNGELFYRRTDDYAMMAVEVSTDPVLTVGPPNELFAGGGPVGGGGARAMFTVTDDGQRFLMSRAVLPSDRAETVAARHRVIVVRNWVEELKERVPVP